MLAADLTGPGSRCSARTVDAREASYVEPFRRSAYKMPAILRANAVTATGPPRRFLISIAQSTIGSDGRERIALHAAWINAQRTFVAPARVRCVRRLASELEFSPGVRPKYDSR